jgi:aldehyde dehydrogenase (NAD+)
MAIDEFPQVIEGEVRPAASAEWIDSIDPATGEVWARIPRSDAADVDAAVDAAARAFPAWASRPAIDRGAALRTIADVIEDIAQQLAQIETRDNGRVMRETQMGDVPACKEMFHFFAGATDKIHGDTVQISSSSFNFTRREPFGVVGVIIPWNAPLSLMAAKVGAALAAGNTVVVKAAEQAACSVLLWAAQVTRAGFPPGVINVVAGYGEEAGDALVRHPGVGRLTFTGSTDTARIIQARGADRIRPLHVELGGKSPNMVFADADLDAAAAGVSTAAVFTGGAGQTCVAGSRILIEASVFDDVVDRIGSIAAGIRLGDPSSMDTDMGPIVSTEQLARVRKFVEGAPSEGAELVFGGRIGGEAIFGADSRFVGGYWVEPTLFRVTDQQPSICREEVFGPVAVCLPFSSDDEAIALANDTHYGLGAGVWTTNLKRAHRMVRDINAGSVWVNSYRRIHWALPFGGFGDSGYGKDSGWESILENTRIKTSWIDLT